MNCPRCGSQNIRRSQSQDSVWFRFVLQKRMRCQRCCYAFAAPLWAQQEKLSGAVLTTETEDVEAMTAVSA